MKTANEIAECKKCRAISNEVAGEQEGLYMIDVEKVVVCGVAVSNRKNTTLFMKRSQLEKNCRGSGTEKHRLTTEKSELRWMGHV